MGIDIVCDAFDGAADFWFLWVCICIVKCAK